jgi:hypothetical protein
MSRSLSNQAHPSPENDGSVQIMAVVVVISGQQRRVQDPVSCWFPAACAAKAEQWPSSEARRRVLVPSVELLRENLPEPDI